MDPLLFGFAKKSSTVRCWHSSVPSFELMTKPGWSTTTRPRHGAPTLMCTWHMLRGSMSLFSKIFRYSFANCSADMSVLWIPSYWMLQRASFSAKLGSWEMFTSVLAFVPVLWSVMNTGISVRDNKPTVVLAADWSPRMFSTGDSWTPMRATQSSTKSFPQAWIASATLRGTLSGCPAGMLSNSRIGLALSMKLRWSSRNWELRTMIATRRNNGSSEQCEALRQLTGLPERCWDSQFTPRLST
mmetsp:Transcript_105277/g.296405  ORF Transcript_105277/g.296405 Transcript_105277/m.296405 type:complete len:243 (-) Transcript_105277:2-730(-)